MSHRQLLQSEDDIENQNTNLERDLIIRMALTQLIKSTVDQVHLKHKQEVKPVIELILAKANQEIDLKHAH